MSSAGPSAAELRQAASVLDVVASSADRTLAQVQGFSQRLSALPGQVEAAVAGTTTHLDVSMAERLRSAGDSVHSAVQSLQATRQAAQRAAEAARAQAAQIERQEQAERAQAARRR